MIYLIDAFSAVTMLTVALLLAGLLNGQNIRRARITYAVAVCLFLSLIIAVCYIQHTKLFEAIAFLIFPIRYIAIILIGYGRFKWSSLFTVVLYEFIVNIIASSISHIFEDVINCSLKMLSISVTITLNLVMTIILSVFHDKIRITTKQISHMIPRHIYILVMCSVLCLGLISTLNNFSTDDVAAKEDIMNCIIVVFTLIIGYIIISLLINVISKQHYSNTTAMLKNQVEIQIRHYDKLEKLNNEMRAFRHDYTNHLHSIHSLIKMNESNDALEYIEKLFNTKHSSITAFTTGNKLADAILTDKADILPENISIDYQGIVPSSIDNIDLCTILSNALDNAIEACAKLTSPGTIVIVAQKIQGYFVLTITNPTECTNVCSDIPTTTKADSEHHGMGLMNIQDVVKKYDGQMKVHCENHIFEISITLKC